MKKILQLLVCVLLVSCSNNGRYAPMPTLGNPLVLDTKTGTVYILGHDSTKVIDPIKGTLKTTFIKKLEDNK